MVVLEKITAPASRNRAAGGASAGAGVSLLVAAPSGTGTPLVAMLSLIVTGTPSSVPTGLAVLPALGRSLCGRARAFGIEGVQRLDVRLPHRDMRQHVLQHFGRRELLGPKARDQVDGGEVVQRRDGFSAVSCVYAWAATGKRVSMMRANMLAPIGRILSSRM